MSTSFSNELRMLARRGGPAWAHADDPLLAGLERWGVDRAAADRRAAVATLVVAAEHAFPRAMAAAGEEAHGMGFGREDEVLDGAAVEVQIELARRWLDGSVEIGELQLALDPTRQLHVYDSDLLPTDERSWQWMYEVGQCCLGAILHEDDERDGHSYYEWSARVCVGRGLVMVARSLRVPGAELERIVDELGAAMGVG